MPIEPTVHLMITLL